MSPRLSRTLVTLLLLVALLTPVLPGRHTCACGMSVGCCCQLKAALRAGDHCMRLKAGTSCGLRREGTAALRLLPKDLGWLEKAPRNLPRPCLKAADRIPPGDEPRLRSLAAAPETPPPRLAEDRPA